MDSYDNELYKHAQAFYPQPVAMACSNIMRATNPAVRLDAIIKASETVCRYIAAFALSAFAARTEASPDADRAAVLNKLDGYKSKDLTFGSFNQIIQHTSKAVSAFPLKAEIVAAITKAQQPIQQLIDIRNELGHDIAAITEARARLTLLNARPETLLKEVLTAFGSLFDYPLFVMDKNFTFVDDTIIGNQVLLMGESSEPCPYKGDASSTGYFWRGGFPQKV
jgi:hypothetical protein